MGLQDIGVRSLPLLIREAEDEARRQLKIAILRITVYRGSNEVVRDT
jgi:hypothetical protein